MAPRVTLQSLLASARELRPKEVKRLQFDPIEAKRACNTGLTTLKKHSKRLRDDFPGFEVDELLLLPELCDALKGAQRKAQTAGPTTSSCSRPSSPPSWPTWRLT
ncbi:MAG: hypothetical protein IAE78_25345, partial [Myxococcus sp.]|nr:hypothetical protein [Myxococcus sp.]